MEVLLVPIVAGRDFQVKKIPKYKNYNQNTETTKATKADETAKAIKNGQWIFKKRWNFCTSAHEGRV